ncbi:bifunctional 4-hydroxy-2-oxoglutarate aldolase/2-dehydro-3-deoxy-phosphogluconate aldolase [Nocardioides sp.]|uniref:bifunctional 4-hydroxy-2-oxoglutarate aldolase/2-dehydro-3-deoxy-phosphogluconate aldolase n=1 Tax=Nocardioides sp. TaxID=35761 RepID=UPI00272917AE|nr:bifunctional 4-hydroxy-2-oxoglutarate aldolase/2-dehydro-3-deoxy-phosphogluconate aldolase [Nocardioides sp.]MDO9456448.1 bifunctional 4-hydroxy-2-oxoglutarate aldolase/2-dehydro-3-deoxy-phosphogluconate aldolase [Nocardioides sp.]
MSGVMGHRVIPVVVLDDPGRADDLGAALVAGGLPVAEATFRSPEAVAVLRRLATNRDLLVGAGTVITAAQVDLAHDAGARFVVSPGLSAAVVRRCQELGLPVFPGVSSATEIITALDLGLDTVKFFPAEANGGLASVKALAAAFPQVRFIPTGGITADTAPTYLAHQAVAAVGGSWMVAPDLLASGQWDEVTARCAATVAATSTDSPVLQGAPA